LLGIGLALLAALCWAAGAILTRVGLQQTRVSQGTLLSLVASIAFVLGLLLLTDPGAFASLEPRAWIWFSLIGILNFSLGRFFNFHSVGLLGVARATPIQAASPIFAMLLAVLFIGERLTFLLVAGALIAVLGVYLIVSDTPE
jgi:drug/metabolite transporter (DMT)-like permease